VLQCLRTSVSPKRRGGCILVGWTTLLKKTFCRLPATTYQKFRKHGIDNITTTRPPRGCQDRTLKALFCSEQLKISAVYPTAQTVHCLKLKLEEPFRAAAVFIWSPSHFRYKTGLSELIIPSEETTLHTSYVFFIHTQKLPIKLTCYIIIEE
jgi:hypothetical protein